MNFVDQLLQISAEEKSNTLSANKEHKYEKEFLDILIQKIQQETQVRARKGENWYGGAVVRDSDGDRCIHIFSEPIKSSVIEWASNYALKTICSGFWSVNENIRLPEGYVEDEQFIVNDLKRRLSEMGFNNPLVQVIYHDEGKSEYYYGTIRWWKRKKCTTVLKKNAFKNLYFKITW